MNGRVIFDNKPGTTYNLYENERSPYEFKNSLKSINSENVLNRTFFSQNNIDMIQNTIINEIIKRTGYKIARQSELQLQIIMRSIFLQYAKNDPCNIKQQIIDLDRKVIDYSVDRIITEISQYLEYKDTINKLPTPLSHPTNLSNAGEKSLSPFRPL
jgi:hypothetical protein|tara:strand:+ start:2511 stop:2981 length:471 start_codon:yes stop_codon:yes gene_type:complete